MVSARQTTSAVSIATGPLVYHVGDALPDLQLDLVYDQGGPVVLTGATVTVAISRERGTTVVKTDTATLTDANNGICIFSWGSFTFVSPGTYIGQCKITFSGGKTLSTQKFIIMVEERVAGL